MEINVKIKHFMLLLILSEIFALNILGVNSSEFNLGSECFYKLLPFVYRKYLSCLC